MKRFISLMLVVVLFVSAFAVEAFAFQYNVSGRQQGTDADGRWYASLKAVDSRDIDSVSVALDYIPIKANRPKTVQVVLTVTYLDENQVIQTRTRYSSLNNTHTSYTFYLNHRYSVILSAKAVYRVDGATVTTLTTQKSGKPLF